MGSNPWTGGDRGETHTIHIPVMEKADRLTGKTIQAVIRLVGGRRCPEHGVRRGAAGGGNTMGGRRGGWAGGGGVTSTQGHTRGVT